MVERYYELRNHSASSAVTGLPCRAWRWIWPILSTSDIAAKVLKLQQVVSSYVSAKDSYDRNIEALYEATGKATPMMAMRVGVGEQLDEIDRVVAAIFTDVTRIDDYVKELRGVAGITAFFDAMGTAAEREAHPIVESRPATEEDEITADG